MNKSNQTNFTAFSAIFTFISVCIMSATLYYTTKNNLEIQRPYLEIQSPSFTFYNSDEEVIKNFLLEKIVYYKISFLVVNHGILPALVTDGYVDFHSYNGEWASIIASLSNYDGKWITIFNGSPQIIETHLLDVEYSDFALDFLKFYKNQKEEVVPSLIDVDLRYRTPLDYDQIYNRNNNSYYLKLDGSHQAHNKSHCDITESSIICNSQVVTPGSKKFRFVDSK